MSRRDAHRRRPLRHSVRRRLGCLGTTVILLLLGTAHVRFWYGARERPAVPDPEALPGRLLMEPPGMGARERPPFELVLWLPYPHQNLAVVRKALGGMEETQEWLAAVLRLAEARTGTEPRLSLPTFGPFPLPPARGMTLALGEGETRGRPNNLLVARIYPSLAWIGRSAGAIAGNPWLKGGRVRAFGGPARVSWDGTLWLIADGEGAPETLAVPDTLPGSSPQPALARLRLGSAAGLGDLPAGGYRLFRPEGVPGDLELALEEPGDADGAGAGDPFEGWGPVLSEAGVVAAWAHGPAASRTGLGLLFGGDGRRGLPPAAVLAPRTVPTSGTPAADSRRLRLIHERLPAFLRDELERAPAGPWLAFATDRDALTAARELAARLPPPEALPDRFLWVDLPALRGFVAAVVELMEEVPLFPRRELRRWRDARIALAPLEGFSHLTLLSRAGSSSGGAPEGGAEAERGERPRWTFRLHLESARAGS